MLPHWCKILTGSFARSPGTVEFGFCASVPVGTSVALLALAAGCGLAVQDVHVAVAPSRRPVPSVGDCSCSVPTTPPRVFPGSPNSRLSRECGSGRGSNAGDMSAPLTLELVAVESCVVGFTTGRCARAVPGDLVLTIRNRLPIRVLLAAQDAPQLLVTGWPVPFEEALSCWDNWDVGRTHAPYYSRAIPLEQALLVERFGTVTMAIDVGLGWPEGGLPCFSGWYSFVVALEPGGKQAELIWAGPAHWHRTWGPDWRGILRRVDSAAGTVEVFGGVIRGYRGTCAEADVAFPVVPVGLPNCLPVGAVDHLFGETCVWPCGSSVDVVSAEVFVWIEGAAEPDGVEDPASEAAGS